MQEIFTALSRGDDSLFIEAMANDIKWIWMGSGQWSRTFEGKSDVITELWAAVQRTLKPPFKVVAKNIFADGDYVAIEAIGQNSTPEGKVYQNKYCWICRVAGCKIYELREYMDTELVTKTFSCSTNETEAEMNMESEPTPDCKSGYKDVNGLKMYYEIYGEGPPLVLIHGGGSTIHTSFGRIIPLLARKRQVIAMELQAHGRTSDREADLSFEQDADDVVSLLKSLNIPQADFFGFSNGGTTALQIAMRHPEIVNKVILGSALSRRNGLPEQFWSFIQQASLDNMPQLLKDAYQQVTPNPDRLQIMHDRDVKRMVNFKDLPDQAIRSIQAPVLIIIGDNDIVTIEHALEMHQWITNSDLAIIPGGHGEYIGEITTLKPGYKETDFIVPLMENFLDKKQ